MDRTGRKLLAVLLTAAACGSGALVAPAIGSPLTRGTSPHRSARGHRHCAVHARRAHHGTHPAVRCGSTHHTAAKQPAGPQGSTPTATSSQPASTTPGETPPAKKPPEVPRIQVTAVEYHYTLSRMTVPAGKVILEFVDKGMDEHNLNVLGGEGELAGSFANAQPGAVTDETLDLKPGSYMLFCSLPEHEAKGMKATLVVE